MVEQPTIAHIHFGPGNLGLGLILLSGIEAGFRVHAIARAGSTLPSDPALEVVIREESGDRVIPLDVGSCCRADGLEDVDDRVRHALAEIPHVLITTAVTTAGLADVSELIVAVAQQRPPGRGFSTTFIACENDPGSAYEPLCTRLRAHGVDCRATMVNRLCSEPKELKRPGARVIRADRLTEWVIAGTANNPALLALDRLPHVLFVVDVKPYEVRKRWLVNGGHLALALMARARRQVKLDIAATEPGRSEWLARLQSAMIGALPQQSSTLEDNESYAVQHVAAWMRHDDDVARVLKRMCRADLAPFFADMDRKLGEPARAIVSNTRDVLPELNEALTALHDILRDFDQYEDYGEIKEGKVQLNSATDDQSVRLYRLWLSGLVDEQTVDVRITQLARSFSEHRDR